MGLLMPNLPGQLDRCLCTVTPAAWFCADVLQGSRFHRHTEVRRCMKVKEYSDQGCDNREYEEQPVTGEAIFINNGSCYLFRYVLRGNEEPILQQSLMFQKKIACINSSFIQNEKQTKLGSCKGKFVDDSPRRKKLGDILILKAFVKAHFHFLDCSNKIPQSEWLIHQR